MQVDLTLEEKSAAALLAVGELAAIKAEEQAGITIDPHEVAVMLGLCNKCRPDGTGEVTWEEIEPLVDDEDGGPGEETVGEHFPIDR